MSGPSGPADRMTVVETIYHHPWGDETQAIESRYGRTLETQEQMYRRNFTATEEWAPLDCGWVPQPGLLHIENREGQNLQTNPTPEEAADIAKRVLEVGFLAAEGEAPRGVWVVLPGESMRGTPEHARGLYVRSRCGPLRYTLCLIPG